MVPVLVQGLSTLKKLRILSMQSNRITKLENLEELTELQELYLSHNGISRIEGLENNVGYILAPFLSAAYNRPCLCTDKAHDNRLGLQLHLGH